MTIFRIRNIGELFVSYFLIHINTTPSVKNKTMKRNYFILFFCSFMSITFSQEDKKKYGEAFKLVEVWLDAQRDFDQLPSLSAVVVENQQTLWSGAFGFANLEENVPAQVSTICSICSISKLFTAIAIMKLYEQEKLRLDDKVSDLLPQYNLQQKFPDSGPVTIRSLLTHSSGLPREANFPYWTKPNFTFPTKQQIDSKLNDQETLYPASTYFQYSNLGVSLLGEIIEELSGVTYEVYIQQNILDPLGLSNTRTDLPEQFYGSKLAIGYSALTRSGIREKVNFFQANGIAPAAGFSSDVTDLGKFASWQFRLRDSKISEILKPSTLKYMQNVHWVNPDWNTTWGLGFSVYKGARGSTWVGHSGKCPGYETTLQMDLKNKRAYAVMVNANGVDIGKYVRGIRTILEKINSKTKWGSKNVKIKKKKLQEYVGYYNTMPWNSEEFVSTFGDNLVVLKLPSNNPIYAMNFYKFIEGDTFRRIRGDNTLGETVVFERDENGKITHYKQHGNYKTRLDR